MDNGVPASPSGSRASHEAADASSPKASIPNAAWFAGFSNSVQTEIPIVRKIGRYLFFAVCAFGCSIIAYALMRRTGMSRDGAHLAGNTALFVSFVALREMSKSWDLALYAAASAIEARRAADSEAGAVHESATRQGDAQ